MTKLAIKLKDSNVVMTKPEGLDSTSFSLILHTKKSSPGNVALVKIYLIS